MATMEELLDEVIKKALDEIKRNADQSFEEAKRIVDKTYNDVLQSYSNKVRDLITKTKEEIEGERAKLDVENKRLVASEKNYWIEKVYEGVKDKIDVLLGSENYKKGLEGVLSREAKNDVIIYCNSKDVDTVSSILNKLKIKAKLKEEKMLGGVKIEFPDQGLVKDFSLDLLLSQVFEAEKPKVAKILFGEE
ncbi:MAG: V-type ATP synthase subunit E [Candidatus Aramenus sulfurataquae]|jgi:V/A-type H+-transporting ATPase subunit E|uniref:A-type ATP synthase subunit E n=3 Tax=Candidatus Aramenus sulfurataquae TaxID=1326980 RepID=A0A0F2LRV7_9CREN|nr:V-type ATP synthase subunit E [Candidatus Aramenus sulfurataquae]